MFDKKILVVFGDSNVWGAELKDAPGRQDDFVSAVYDPKDKNCPYHIRHGFPGVMAESANMKILNLAIPGCSNDTIFRRVNKFVQGHYAVDLNDCALLIFWTGNGRREFYMRDYYLNYSPTWPSKFQAHKTFHKIYSKDLWNEQFDLNKTFNYIFSIGPLLQHYDIWFRQGFSIENIELSKLVKTYNISNFLSYRYKDSIHSIIGSKGRTFQMPLLHPNEKGHRIIAAKYMDMIEKRI